MPRRRPSAVRAALRRPAHHSDIDALSASTCHTLNRLDRDPLRPDAIQAALSYWRWLAGASDEDLTRAFDNPLDELWPRQRDQARGALEAAVQALPRPAARELGVQVDRNDAAILARTSPAYYRPGARFWWQGRTVRD